MPLFPLYRTCTPSQYLAVTGFGIDGVKMLKKGWILPGQQSCIVDISPENYEFDIHAMSSEMLPFSLPAVFTIGPRLDLQELQLYAQLLTDKGKRGREDHVHTVIKGIVEGETRVLAASLTMKDIFQGTKVFKTQVFERVQLELDQFGLKIYNANIKQLSDLPGHEYFSYLGQKTQKEAANQAKVDIALAERNGNIGSKNREGETLREMSKIQNETDMFRITQDAITATKRAETAAHVEMQQNASKAEVLIKKAKLDQDTRVAAIEAEKTAQIRAAVLENDLNQRLVQAETERFRAEQLSQAVVETEVANQRADAGFYQKQREAQSIQLLADAQAAASKRMIEAFDGNVQNYLAWMAMDTRLYEKLAQHSASAVQGLKPNVSVWNTGSGGGASSTGGIGGTDVSRVIADLCQIVPPLFDTIERQTGMQLLPGVVNRNICGGVGK